MPIIATDGSSLGTQTDEGRKAEGPGAFAVVIRFENDHPKSPGFTQTMTGGKRVTTTGEIELLGFIAALEAVRDHKEAMEVDPSRSVMAYGDIFTIVLDSEYVLKSFNEHLDQWIENGWRTSSFRRISHQVLWQDVDALRREVGHMIRLVHQKGHTRRSGDIDVPIEVEMNDLADQAAGRASRAIRDGGLIPIPKALVWTEHATAQADRQADIRKLAALTAQVLKTHGRAAAVDAFREATHATGIKE